MAILSSFSPSASTVYIVAILVLIEFCKFGSSCKFGFQVQAIRLGILATQ